VHDGEVGDEPALHHIAFTAKLALLLAFADRRAGAGTGEKCRNAGAACANPLRQRALRVEFDLELAGEILLGKRLVLPDIRRDHFLDLPGVEKEAKPDAVNAGIVGDDREIFHARVTDRFDQSFRNAAKPEAAGHDHHAVLEQAGERRLGVGIDFFHERSVSAQSRRCWFNSADSLSRCRIGCNDLAIAG